MSWRHILITLACAALVLTPTTVAAQEPCPNSPIANPSFEDGSHSAGDHGAPPAYVIGNGWSPWSTWGESPHSREAEFDVEDITLLGRYSTYRVNSGKHSQKFSTIYATHNAGVYQRIAVPKGSKVTFSVWVQMYTGEETLWWDEEYYSDLNSPGNYRVYVGLDPYGDEPPGFGTPPSDRTIWSTPVLDRETRREGDHGRLYDAWVNIQVEAEAQAGYITVYTRGQPEFAVRHNVSYWDDACLVVVAPTPAPTSKPIATPTPERTETPTPEPSATPTEVPPLTDTPLPTDTLLPTETARPTETVPAPATKVPEPTATTAPPPTPTKAAPAATGRPSSDNPFLLLIFAVVWLAAAGYTSWSLWQKRRTASEEPGT